MSDASAAPAPQAFDLDSLIDDNEFLGVVTVDEMVTGDHGPQWHYGIKPIDYDLGGKTGLHHEYVRSDVKLLTSKYGKTLMAFVTVFGRDSAKKVGAGEFIGKAAVFKRVRTNWGKRKGTAEEMVSEQLLPLRKPDDAELSRVTAKGITITQETPAAVSLSEEAIVAVLKVVDGCDPQKAVSAAARSRLPADLKGGILNGTLLPQLIATGRLMLDDGGTYQIPLSGVTPAEPVEEAELVTA